MAGQARKEVACQPGEPMGRRESAKSQANVTSGWAEEAGQVGASNGQERLVRRLASHLSEVRSAARADGRLIDSVAQSRNDIQQARRISDRNVEGTDRICEVGGSRSERNLRELP
jgi:hypothetical protein